jgi:hypothetical protein
MKDMFLITYLEDEGNYDLVQKMVTHGPIVQAKMLVTSREINTNFESVPNILFYSSTVFRRAVPVTDKKDLPKYVPAATKTALFAELLTEGE